MKILKFRNGTLKGCPHDLSTLKSMIKYIRQAFLLLLLSSTSFAQQRVDIGSFSKQDLQGWKQKEFSGSTQYSLKKLEKQTVLAADSKQSASAFYKSIKIDLDKTPILNWSWSKQQQIEPKNESVKSGDDFVARIYVIKDGGFLFWKTQVINYVWSFRHTKDESWDNPFAGKNAKMFSIRDADNPAQQWYSEKRNIKLDFEMLHGKKINHIDGIAIMTDSDNSQSNASAYYGDIYFSAE